MSHTFLDGQFLDEIGRHVLGSKCIDCSRARNLHGAVGIDGIFGILAAGAGFQNYNLVHDACEVLPSFGPLVGLLAGSGHMQDN